MEVVKVNISDHWKYAQQVTFFLAGRWRGLVSDFKIRFMYPAIIDILPSPVSEDYVAIARYQSKTNSGKKLTFNLRPTSDRSQYVGEVVNRTIVGDEAFELRLHMRASSKRGFGLIYAQISVEDSVSEGYLIRTSRLLDFLDKDREWII